MFVVFGGTGDLAKRKLAPAFADLVHREVIGLNSTLIGIARGGFNDKSYKDLLIQSSDKEDHDNLSKLNIKFFQGDASNPSSLDNLSQLVHSINKNKSRIIFYLATSFKLFSPILEEIKKQELNKNSIIIFEKPFGESYKSAEELEEELSLVFEQENIFRIDHYLAKHGVKEISLLKFDVRDIESIKIIADESLGVGERLNYYNHSGAINDMIQNHLLQLLALFGKNKYSFLKSLSFNKNKNNLLGEYSSYKSELKNKGLDYAKTETFARIHLSSSLPEWKNVDFILQTGKNLDNKQTKIVISFKSKNSPIVLDITKSYHDEYSVLIESVIKNKRDMFPSTEEIFESWRIVEQIDKSSIPFVIYKDGINSENIK